MINSPKKNMAIYKRIVREIMELLSIYDMEKEKLIELIDNKELELLRTESEQQNIYLDKTKIGIVGAQSVYFLLRAIIYLYEKEKKDKGDSKENKGDYGEETSDSVILIDKGVKLLVENEERKLNALRGIYPDFNERNRFSEEFMIFFEKDIAEFSREVLKTLVDKADFLDVSHEDLYILEYRLTEVFGKDLKFDDLLTIRCMMTHNSLSPVFSLIRHILSMKSENAIVPARIQIDDILADALAYFIIEDIPSLACVSTEIPYKNKVFIW